MSPSAPAASAPTASTATGGTTDAVGRDADELFAALRSLFACTRRMRSWIADAGSMTVLSVVDEHGEARVGALAAALHVDVSTISRSLAALGRDGLVQWRPDERDARSHLVSCTDAGRDRLAATRAQMTNDLTARLSDWPESDVADLSRLLHRFVSDVLTEPVGRSTNQTSRSLVPEGVRMTAATTTPEESLGSPAPAGVAPASGQAPAKMSHRQILEALSGLLLAMFVAMLSSTVVSNALPRIVSDLHGSETSYTWVVTATLLAMTASTPLWGKLSDLVSRKLLMQIALVVYVVGSMAAGLSQSAAFLIGCRAIQGAGAGGVLALTQVILAAMVSPRERGRYSGYLGAVFAVATISGPLLGGVIVDTSWLGWRWCFYVGVPFAAFALVVLQKTLHLPQAKRKAKVDYLGAALIVSGVSLLLIWVSLAGNEFDWLSGQTAAMIAGGVVLLALAVLVELRAAEPIIPLELFRHRTVSLATIASLFVGVALFGATIFLSQYFQIARGKTPTVSGLMTMPLILGLALSSLIVGRIITRTGSWKRFLVGGAVLVTVGFGLLGTTSYDTPLVIVGTYMAIAGVGVGMTMQNLVLSVQNSVPMRELGSATATVSFFRSLGGAIGVSALGAVLASHVRESIASGLAAKGIVVPAGSSETLPNPSTLPPAVRTIVESAYGEGTALIFTLTVPLLVLAVVAVVAIREVPLRTSNVEGSNVDTPVIDTPNIDTPSIDSDEAAAVAAPVDPTPAPQLSDDRVEDEAGPRHVEQLQGSAAAARA